MKLKRHGLKLLESNRQLRVKYTENFKFNKDNFDFSEAAEDDYRICRMQNDSSEDTTPITNSFSEISRKLKTNPESIWLFKESSMGDNSIIKSRTSMRYAMITDGHSDKENRNATEQKILHQLNEYSSNGFLSPGEDKLGRIMGSQLKFDSNDNDSAKQVKLVSQPNFKKNCANFSGVSINKNLAHNQPLPKNLINEFRNLTSAKKTSHQYD